MTWICAEPVNPENGASIEMDRAARKPLMQGFKALIQCPNPRRIPAHGQNPMGGGGGSVFNGAG